MMSYGKKVSPISVLELMIKRKVENSVVAFFDIVKGGLECFALYQHSNAQRDWIEENRYLRETLLLERQRTMSLEGQFFGLQNNVADLAEQIRSLVDAIVVMEEEHAPDSGTE